MTGRSGGRVHLLTLGCRLNQAESEETLRALRRADVHVAAGGLPGRGAGPDDVVVVNTCTVTSDASKSSRKLVRRAADSGARVVVTGCYAVAAPELCEELPGVVAVVANKDKDHLAATVSGLGGLAHTVTESAEGGGAVVRQAFKVQTGCDEACTFCIIPQTRGVLSSRSGDVVVDGVRAQVAAGAAEVTLTGVHLGKYGLDTDGRPRLAGLVRRVLAEVDGLRWLRLSSIECGWVDDELLAAMDDARVCPHLHIPLQSGCDTTLAAMGRPYTTAQYAAVARRVRDVLGADAGLTTDVLVGFPGESETNFAATAEFVERIGFTKLHVFRYSPRPGTAAAGRAGQVPEDVKKDRSARLRRIGDGLTAAFGARFVGRELYVMIEQAERDRGVDRSHVRPTLTGTAGNYLKVTTAGPAGLVGEVVAVAVESASTAGVTGGVRWGTGAPLSALGASRDQDGHLGVSGAPMEPPETPTAGDYEVASSEASNDSA